MKGQVTSFLKRHSLQHRYNALHKAFATCGPMLMTRPSVGKIKSPLRNAQEKVSNLALFTLLGALEP